MKSSIINLFLGLAFCCAAIVAVTASPQSEAPSIRVQDFPAIGSMYEKLDLNDPYKTVVSGLFREPVKVGESEREFLVYIAESNRQANPYICLIPDAGQDPVEFLVESGWKEIADGSGSIIVIMRPLEGAWDFERDLPYLKAMYSQSRKRQWYNVQKGNSYLAGYADGASMAQQWSMIDPAAFASMASFGNLAVSEDFMISAAGRSTDRESIKAGEIPVPVWMFVEKSGEAEKAVLDYWKSANNADTRQSFCGEDLDVLYLAQKNPLNSLLDEQDMIAQTRLTETSDALKPNVARTQKVWEFLSSVTRTGGILNGDLRPAYTLEEWQAKKRTIIIDGVTRHWFEFVPEKLYPTDGEKAPLVVAMHGQSTTADAFLWRSEWIKLANERGFMVVFPAASLTQSDKVMPRPSWNTINGGSDDQFDDLKFLREMVREVSGRLPVDKTRVYATGQSMGGMTSLSIAIDQKNVFAAIAIETGFLITDETGAPSYTSQQALANSKVPVFIVIGEHDLPPFLDEKVRKGNMSYWISLDEAGSYDKPYGQYVDGRYNITTWAFNNIPIVQYALQLERPHAPVPSDNLMLYDGFLSRWSRNADGTLNYLGKSIE